MGAFEGGFAEQHTVVSHDADRVAVQVGETGDQGVAVVALELGELAGIDEPADDLADVVGLVRLRRDHAVEILGRHGRRSRRPHRPGRRVRGWQGGDDVAHDLQGVVVVLGEVVRDPGDRGVQRPAAELLGGDLLADRGLHQRRSAQEDGALLAHDHRLIAHGRHVGAAGRARAEDRRDLRNALGRHPCLVVEDAPEVLAIGEHLVLQRQERAAGIHEVDARQPVLAGDLLGAQVLLDRHRVVGAALDGGVVADHHHVPIADQTDASDEARPGRGVVVETGGREWCDLQERAALVEQPIDAFSRQ